MKMSMWCCQFTSYGGEYYAFSDHFAEYEDKQLKQHGPAFTESDLKAAADATFNLFASKKKVSLKEIEIQVLVNTDFPYKKGILHALAEQGRIRRIYRLGVLQTGQRPRAFSNNDEVDFAAHGETLPHLRDAIIKKVQVDTSATVKSIEEFIKLETCYPWTQKDWKKDYKKELTQLLVDGSVQSEKAKGKRLLSPESVISISASPAAAPMALS